MMTVSPDELIETLDAEMLEYIMESYGDLPNPFFREDIGWRRIGEFGEDEVIGRDIIANRSRLARIMSVADPLIRRAVSLHTAYVFGQGVSISADQEENSEQDVNAVVQGFLDDPSNVGTFSSQQAHEEMERLLQTEGQIFHALPTDQRTGRVQVRRIPFRQIQTIISDPEDADTPWFYRREWETVIVEPSFSGLTTRSRRETRRALYPALGFRPNVRPKTIDGLPVNWDVPVHHTRVNRLDGSPWGTPDLLAALPWAEGYKEFLEDWAKLIKALSKFAWRATAKGRNTTTVRDRIAAADPGVGGTIVQGPDQRFEAISKSGATIDSGSGRPLAAMVAAATDLPVTMLLGDPGVTGARATAETLDQPLALRIKARQTLYTAMFTTIITYAIDQSIKAPAGLLKGTVKIDPITKLEVVTLANDQPKTIQVDWPSIEKVPLETLVKAIIEADSTNLLPELLVAKLLLMALDVDEPDEVLAGLVDDQGNFVPPRGSPSSPTDVAAQAAAEAYRRGEDASEYV